jgi:hypothetical protein
MSLSGQKFDAEELPSVEWVAETRDKIRRLEADLHDQGSSSSPTRALGNMASIYGARSRDRARTPRLPKQCSSAATHASTGLCVSGLVGKKFPTSSAISDLGERRRREAAEPQPDAH